MSRLKSLFFGIAIISGAFGATVSAQTTETTTQKKPARTYAKKNTATTTQTTVKPEISVKTNTTSPKRTYAKSTTTKTEKPEKTEKIEKPVVKNTAKIAKNTAKPKSVGTQNNHKIMQGPRGGKYYINKNGNKTYVN